MRIRTVGLAALVGVLVTGAIIFLSGIASNGSGRSANAGSESEYKGLEQDRPAPAFTLTDQRGEKISLAGLRGKVVVLTLLDPHCTDICPVYANHYRLAYNALEDERKDKVSFLAFNANGAKTSVEEVKAATQKWRLDDIPTFHFLTGSPEELQEVWGAYNVEASGDPKPDNPDELQHSPAIFVIDQSGKLRWYLSTNFEGAPAPSKLIREHVNSLLDEEDGWW